MSAGLGTDYLVALNECGNDKDGDDGNRVENVSDICLVVFEKFPDPG